MMKLPEGVIRAAYTIIEQAGERVLITDRQGMILYVNPAFERLTGYNRSEAIGQSPRLLRSGEHPPEFYRELWSVLLSGQSFRARFVNRTKSGELYYEEQTIAPLRDQGGQIAYFISTATDITRQVKQAQAHQLVEESFARLRQASWAREERVLELKHEVNALLAELGRKGKYLL